MAELFEVENYTAQLLEVSRFRDYCPNGLQVEGRAQIGRLISGVTASLALLQAAIEDEADAILVHHGYFWRNEDARVVGIKRKRLALLLEHGISLLAYHLPLDAHPTLGNNAQLAQQFGFEIEGRFGEQNIAVHGRLPEERSLAMRPSLSSSLGPGQRPPRHTAITRTISWATTPASVRRRSPASRAAVATPRSATLR